MAKEVYEAMNQWSEMALDNYRKLCATNLKVSEKLLQEQADLMEVLCACAKSSAEQAAEAKDLPGLASTCAEAVQEQSQSVLEAAKSCAEIIAESAKTFQSVWDSGVKSANVNVAKAATKTKRKA
jgi:Phasin protein